MIHTLQTLYASYYHCMIQCDCAECSYWSVFTHACSAPFLLIKELPNPLDYMLSIPACALAFLKYDPYILILMPLDRKAYT